jgi:RND family efflux transporter MFP subunit
VGTTTKMATVSQVDPIWAYFNISESHFLEIAPHVTQIITGKANISSTASTPIEYIQANNQTFPTKGEFVYVNRQVGTQTGTIQVAAQFRNPGAVLRPGGFGRIRIQSGVNKGALLVPQAAVTQVQSMYMLAIVTPENKAVFRPVKVGDRVGTNWIITEGLKPGERVVVDGLLKIADVRGTCPELAKTGIPVVAKPYVPPAAPAGGN